MTDPAPSNLAQDDRPAIARLEESLRDLVQDEMGHVRAITQPQVPSRSDAFWLFLSAADAALLLWIIPDAMLTNKRLELLGKIVTWLGGSLFVLGYVWFRERFLGYVRNRGFKITLAVIPVMVVPFYLTQFDIFRIKPVVEPSSAELEIQGEKRSIENLKVSLSGSTVIVRLRGQGPNAPVYERPFPMTAGDVWRSWFYNEQPYWPLVFEVPLGFNKEGPEKIVASKETKVFDSGYVPELTYMNGAQQLKLAGTWEKDKSISWGWPYEPGTKNSIRLTLPYGKYRLIATYADNELCPKTSEDEIDVKPGIEASELSIKRKCEAQRKPE
jgi:hypothetical protein